jgi:hypothetical protein
VEWSKKFVLFCHVTTGIEKEPNEKLLSEKGGQGFPYLVFMDAEGRVLSRHEGQRNVEGFNKTLGEARGFLELKKKAEGGDKDAVQDLFMRQLDLGHFKAEEARKKLAEMADLPKEKRDKAEARIVELEFGEILATVTQQKKTRVEAGRRFSEMKKAGRIPAGEQETAIFYTLIMDAAESDKDAAAFEDALNALKAKFGERPQAKSWFEKQEVTLKKLKEEKK